MEAMKMAKEPRASAENPARNRIQVARRAADDKPDDAIARTLTRPEVQAAAVIQQFGGSNHEVNALIRELSAQVAAVNRGDMSRAEAMLIAQAHTLDELFANLARRSSSNIGAGYLDAADRYMRLALKAQSQCRTTLETLAEIKNPRAVAFVRQANISHGPQQVNNGMAVPSRTDEAVFQSNELSGSTSELLPDTRAQSITGGVNQEVGAMAEIYRP
jgi:hypothetical protein